MRRRSASLLLLACAPLLLTSCVPEPDAGPTPTPTPLTEEQVLSSMLGETVEPEWTVALESVGSEVVRIDDVVLLYTTHDEGTYLQALDAESGDTLWEAPATSGASGVDDPWAPVVARDAEGDAVTMTVGAAEQQADGNWAHPLTLRDARTGEARPSPAATWVSTVWECDEGLCLYAWEPSDDPEGIWREATLDVGSAELVPGEETGGSTGSWQMTDNLLLGVDEDYLAWRVDGEEVWRTTLSDLLPDGVSPDVFGGGFSFRVAVDEPFAPTAAMIDFEAPDGAAAGAFAFALDDGHPLWAHDDIVLCSSGVAILCPLEDVGAADDVEAPDEPVAQTYRGLDVATGEETWSTTLDEVTTGAEAPAANAIGYLRVIDGGAAMYLAADTGEATPSPEGAITACIEETTWMGYENARSTDEWTEFSTGVVASPCDATGEPVAGAFSRSAVVSSTPSAWRDGEELSSAAVLGGATEDPLDDSAAWYYVATDGGVEAYRF
ncbi:hypothetical protein N8K70_01585 [Microbacterium betulae]|uniref:Pyrrolo-quinoline quinone n=1 Tax=Microbacterium betulae TaxID=2981139 RepID=A0AA97FHP2_9MICO|nr:hypothetical protein [Microbacterium sp. AB]WOF23393.1 hypothetical protein N8K70_01585 [Microbacterium sp. AB]